MSSVAKFVGLDVHQDSISIAVAEQGREDPRFLRRVPNNGTRLLRVLSTLGDLENLRCAYEAGPTGYGLHRFLCSKGVRCEVVAPSEIPIRPGKRVKTDRIDAQSLAHHLRAGNLVPILVPDEESEAMRDLVRARADAKVVEKSAKHRLGKFLLRHGRHYPGRTKWTQAHHDWIARQPFDRESQRVVLREYLRSVRQAREQIARITDELARLAETSRLAPMIRALQAMRGIQLLTAATIAYELVDLRRFESAPKLMGYLGLVPSEYSSGKSRKQGSITKAGNTHVRWILTEAAWNNRHPPKVTAALRRRQEGVAPEVIDIAERAQERLHRKYRSMMARGKRHQCVITAMARELVGFIWQIGQEERLLTA